MIQDMIKGLAENECTLSRETVISCQSFAILMGLSDKAARVYKRDRLTVQPELNFREETCLPQCRPQSQINNGGGKHGHSSIDAGCQGSDLGKRRRNVLRYAQ